MHESAVTPEQAQNFLGTSEDRQRIPVNVYEALEALVIVAPMPGVRSDDVEITVTDDEIRLSADLRTAAPKPYLIHEWDYGSYERVLPLPEGYGAEVTATLGHGQLAVRLARGPAGPDPLVVRPSEPASGATR